MDIPVEDVELEETSPEEAFAVLGNETRMEILRALWEAEGPASFSALRRRVAPDDNGNFSYHLGRLTDRFVRKTDDGYVLRFAGEQVVRAVLTGTITADLTIPPAGTDERCPYCGATVEVAYEEERISARCTGCAGVVGGDYPDGTYMHYEFPPSGLEGRTREEVVDVAHVLYDSKFTPMTKGVCPECAGPVDVSHDVCPDHAVPDAGLCPTCDTRYEVWSRYTCESCRYSRRTVMWFAALTHPAVVAFLHRHGLEETIPIRKLTRDNARFVRHIAGTAVSTDPYRFRVTIAIEDDSLEVLLDDDLSVSEVRERARTARATGGCAKYQNF